jgi:hypothetical protein
MRITKSLTEQTKKNKIRRLEKHIRKVTIVKEGTPENGATTLCNDNNALERLKTLNSI